MQCFRSIYPYVASFAVLLAACTKQEVQTATPSDELPGMLLPPSLARGDKAKLASVEDSAPLAKAPEKTPPPTPVGNDDGRTTKPAPMPASAMVVAAPQPAAYVLIVGIEKYRDVVAAAGARQDAEKFAEMVRTTMGVPASNIEVLLDDRANRSDITKQLRWVQSNARAGGRVYFYFSGHGAPDPTTGLGYLLPYDGDPRYLKETAITLGEVMTELEKSKAKEVLVLTDACFSGSGERSVLAPGTRPIVRIEAPRQLPRVALLSAATGVQTAGPASEGGGGVFSKYLIAGLGTGQADINGDGQISLQELTDWLRPRVERESRLDNREQTPQLGFGKKLGNASEFIVAWGYGQ